MSTLVFPSMTTPAPPKAPDVQDFTSSGTWVDPADGWVRGVCELIGGAQAWLGSSSIGRGGSYARFGFVPSQVSATEVVTIGAGNPANNSGAPGGTTSFGTFPIKGTGGNAGTPLLGQVSDTSGDSSFAAGSGNTGTPYRGGTLAAAYGYLQAGDGGGSGSPNGKAPGGAGGYSGSIGTSAAGAARITLYYA